jgi:hypothetical protein
MILDDFCLLPAWLCYVIMNVRNLESHMHIADRCAPRKGANGGENFILQALQAWTSLHEYHDTWAHLNGLLHTSLPSVCMCAYASVLSMLGKGSINFFPSFVPSNRKVNRSRANEYSQE